MDYREKLQQLINNLSNSPKIEIISQAIDYSEGEELAEFCYEDLINDNGYYLDEKYMNYILVSIYSQLRYVCYHRNEVVFGGELHLYPLYDTLRSNADPQLWHDDMDSEKIKFLKTLRVFDDHPDSGDFKLAAFSKLEGINPPNIPDIYFYDRGEVYKMNLDYGEYLDKLLDLGGISDWQYLFCDVDKNDRTFGEIFKELEKAMSHLEQILPNRDYTEYYRILRK